MGNIYKEHLAEPRNSEQVEDIGDKLSDEISQVMAFVSAAAGSTHAYGDSLEGVGTKLENARSHGELKSVVETLVLASREMERNSRSLEEKLQNSQTQINELNERLKVVRAEALTDQLTGIANRKHFDESLEKETAIAEETGEELCLCIGDIDHFKAFNDTYGHQTGDQVLRLVARTIAANVKGRDLAARYGGEEFAIILPQTNLRAAITVADQIRQNVMGKELVKKSTGENLGTITLSLGVARYRTGEPLAQLIQRADASRYVAKHAGRNMVKCESDSDVNLEIEAA
ncbi:MAG: GGDEF domain-containing protein [Alphaproteobacteria bacterium]